MHLTVQEAARLLGAPEKQVYRWIQNDQMPCLRVGDQFRFDPAALLEWATIRRLPISPEVVRGLAEGHGDRPLLAALTAGGLHREVPGRTREEVLRAVATLLPVPDEAERETLLEMLLARESMGSTAIGEGIAIPHVRSPLVLPGSSATCLVCYLAQGVAFGAADGLPVDTVFALLSPTVHGHLRILARLAAALHDPGFRRALRGRAPTEAVLAEVARIEAALPGEGASATGAASP